MRPRREDPCIPARTAIRARRALGQLTRLNAVTSRMATFEIIDLQSGTAYRSGDRASRALGSVDTQEISQQLDSLRHDINELFHDREHLGLKSITIKLAITAEGKVAFIAKGTLEASVEIHFER